MRKLFKALSIFLIIVVAGAAAFYLVKKQSILKDEEIKIAAGNNFNPSVPDTVVADHVLLNVPFISQAPLAHWEDPKQEDGCEEASVLAAMLWVQDKTMTPATAEKTIIALADFEIANYGDYHDTNAQDTTRLFTDYYHYTKFSVKERVSIDDIKSALRQGRLVLVPSNGQKLGNPNFKRPGPLTHFLVIRGFDDKKGVFITNDPGTRKGNLYEYKYNTLFNAMVNYPTGQHLPQSNLPNAMIVVEK